MRWRSLALAFALSGLVHAPAAPENLARALVKSGDWAAIERIPTGRPSPPVCLAIDPLAGVALRAAASGADLMVGNYHWDLPAAAHLAIQVVIGPNARTLPITGNTNKTVFASLDPSTLRALLDEMTAAAAMRVTVGTNTPLKISLTGSAAVLTAFRTCAGLG